MNKLLSGVILATVLIVSLIFVLSGCTNAPQETPSGGTNAPSETTETEHTVTTDAPDTVDTAAPSKLDYEYVTPGGEYIVGPDGDAFDEYVDRDDKIVVTIYLACDRGDLPTDYSDVTQAFADEMGLTDCEDYSLKDFGKYTPEIILTFENFESYKPYTDWIRSVSERSDVKRIIVEPQSFLLTQDD